MPQFLYDLGGIDLNRVLFDQEQVRAANPQRGCMEMLNAIVWTNPELGRIVGYKDIKTDEPWIPGHIPGRPLFPGVYMIEAAAQLASFYTRTYVGWKGFIGFGGVEDTKFRAQVQPGCRLYLIGQKQWERHHRIRCVIQGMVDSQLVFETAIIGVEF